MPSRNHLDVDEHPYALEAALDKSEEVKAKVEACADDLAATNDLVKKRIADGVTTLPAEAALANGVKVEDTVQECAADLHEVTETLAHGIDELKNVEVALVQSKQTLAETELALCAAQIAAEGARLRALHDSLTGLPNRELFDDRLAQAISLADRHDWTLAVMFLDLDRFKAVNDSHGHAAGDSILREVAHRLLQHAREEDTICRNGGDEFLYLLMNPLGNTNIERIARATAKNIARAGCTDDLHVAIKTSIGIAVYPGDGHNGDELVRNADAAMYRAKKCSDGFAFFSGREGEKICN